jgi:tryptophanyl-tRNA synthetase
LGPLRERRREFEKKPDYVKQILYEGGNKARAIARETIGEVYEKMGLGKYV